MRARVAWFLFAAVVGLGGCKKEETSDELGLRMWLTQVNGETNEVRIDAQIAMCVSPPSNALPSARLRCSEYLAPAAIRYATPKVQAASNVQIPKGIGPVRECRSLLDGLALVRPDYAGRADGLKLAAEKCCAGSADLHRRRCEAIGIKVPKADWEE